VQVRQLIVFFVTVFESLAWPVEIGAGLNTHVPLCVIKLRKHIREQYIRRWSPSTVEMGYICF